MRLLRPRRSERRRPGAGRARERTSAAEEIDRARRLSAAAGRARCSRQALDRRVVAGRAGRARRPPERPARGRVAARARGRCARRLRARARRSRSTLVTLPFGAVTRRRALARRAGHAALAAAGRSDVAKAPGDRGRAGRRGRRVVLAAIRRRFPGAGGSPAAGGSIAFGAALAVRGAGRCSTRCFNQLHAAARGRDCAPRCSSSPRRRRARWARSTGRRLAAARRRPTPT